MPFFTSEKYGVCVSHREEGHPHETPDQMKERVLLVGLASLSSSVVSSGASSRAEALQHTVGGGEEEDHQHGVGASPEGY